MKKQRKYKNKKIRKMEKDMENDKINMKKIKIF